MPKNNLFYYLSVPYTNIISGRQEADGDQLALISKGAAGRIPKGLSPLFLCLLSYMLLLTFLKISRKG